MGNVSYSCNGVRNSWCSSVDVGYGSMSMSMSRYRLVDNVFSRDATWY